jgi:hypothetical protein
MDPYARSVREDYETNVEAPFAKGGEKIARALFALRGLAAYPDATGTLRLSFGQARGPVNDEGIGPFVTTIGGAFLRSTGRDPFALPASWLQAKEKLNLGLPLNVATTNETVGGNSGSPLLNKNAELIGLRSHGVGARMPMAGGRPSQSPGSARGERLALVLTTNCTQPQPRVACRSQCSHPARFARPVASLAHKPQFATWAPRAS